MSKKAIDKLKAKFSGKILETNDFRGDHEATVAVSDWVAVATFLLDELGMNLFVDLTAVDWPERAPEEPRFDVLLIVRSLKSGETVRIKTKVAEDKTVPTLVEVWAGANWAEREIFDMFGIRFDAHPDLRRILMYEEFEGHPLRKDYPIEKAQPLVPYRDVAGIEKLPPFGRDEGQPFARIDWQARLSGGDYQVSPSIALQSGQRRTLSDSEAAEELQRKIARALEAVPEATKADN